MKNNKVIPNWLSIILLILCIFSLVLTVYMAITVKSATPGLTVFASILFMITIIYAIIYCWKGYSKDANKYYKWFAMIFLITELVTVIGFITVTIQMKTDISLEALSTDNYLWFIGFSIVMLVCMFPLTLAKDLKKKHATILAAIHLVCAIAAMILSLGEDVEILSNNYIKNLLVTVIFDAMIYAKYKDKEIRKSNNKEISE